MEDLKYKLIETIGQLNKVNTIDELIEGMKYLKLDLTLIGKQDSVAVLTIQSQLTMLITDLPDMSLDRKKGALIDYLNKFLDSDYFRTDEEIDLNNAYNQIRYSLTIFDKYRMEELPWDYLGKLNDVIVCVNKIKELDKEAAILCKYHDRIAKDKSLYLSLNTEIIEILKGLRDYLTKSE